MSAISDAREMIAVGDSFELARLVAEDGFDINARDEVYGTFLHTAVANQQTDIIKLLVNSGLNINSISSKDRLCNTPLHDAVQLGSIECVNQLLKLKADINSRNDLGLAPIALATLKGDESMCRTLLKYEDCDVNIRDNDGKTCFDHAKENGFYHLMSLYPESQWNLEDDPQWQSLIEETVKAKQAEGEKKAGKGKGKDKKGKGKKKK